MSTLSGASVPSSCLRAFATASPEAAALRALARAALAPSIKVPADVWADRHRVLGQDTSDRPGPWSTDAAPYLRGVMRAWSDPRVETITFRKGSQVGATEAIINCFMCAVDTDPGPAMLVYPNADLAASLLADRVVPAIKATPRIMARLRGTAAGKESPRDIKSQQINFDRMPLYAVGSNSEANLASRPIRYLGLDEMDSKEFMPGALELARQRTKAFARPKIFENGTPGLAGQGIDARYELSDRRRYEVPCPHCREYQELLFAGVKWEGGTKAEPRTVLRTAWYECCRCKKKITNADKHWMLARGIWLREGERAEGRGPSEAALPSALSPAPCALDCCGLPLPEGVRIVGEPANPNVEHAGFRLNSIYSPWLPFGHVAAKFVEAGGVPNRAWVNGELGEPWQTPGEKADPEDLMALCVAVKDGGYRLCAGPAVRPPPGVLALVGGIDLQRDRAYVEVRGFGERGLNSWLVWFFAMPCPVEEEGSLGNLDRLLAMRFGEMNVAAWAVDSGDGLRTKEVYDWCAGKANVVASKGVFSSAMSLPQQLKVLEPDPQEARRLAARGEQTPRTRLLLVNTGYWKSAVFTRLKRGLAHTPGSVRAAMDPGDVGLDSGRMLWPAVETSEERAAMQGYFHQLTAEELVLGEIGGDRRSGRPGRPAYVWQRRPGRKDNHFLDTCVLTHALADALGVSLLTAVMATPGPQKPPVKREERAPSWDTGQQSAEW